MLTLALRSLSARAPHLHGTFSGINSMIQSVLSRDPSQMAGIPHSRLAFENFATGSVFRRFWGVILLFFF